MMMRIFHLDAGRKYFGVEAIKRILDQMAENGFTHLELYFSDNQGFRFALDDMTVTTSFGSYDLTPCLGDGYCEGPKSPSGCGKYLTAADMEQILAYAAGKGIALIPLLNMPGHMGCILERYSYLRRSDSKSSIDLDNPEAVAFALGILRKYVDYFAAKGCTHFHFGADEYCNDIAPGYPDEIVMGFEQIYRGGGMGAFVNFANAACRIIKDRGMIPMAFSDGVCYNDDSHTYGEIDHDLVLCYWNQGWLNYSPAKAVFLEGEGYRLVNASGEYYCGMGCRDWPGRVEKAASFDPHIFHKDAYIKKPYGAMLCFWSDRGSFDGPDDGAKAASDMAPVFKAFGKAMDRAEKN